MIFRLPAFINVVLCAPSLALTVFVMIKTQTRFWVLLFVNRRNPVFQGFLKSHRQNRINCVIQQSCGCSRCSCWCVPKHPSDSGHCAGEAWWIVSSSMGEQYVIVPPQGWKSCRFLSVPSPKQQKTWTAEHLCDNLPPLEILLQFSFIGHSWWAGELTHSFSSYFNAVLLSTVLQEGEKKQDRSRRK